MTLEYELFSVLPFNFCGSWVQRSQYNFNTCPEDGKYHFEIPYRLPGDYDLTTWFATGWSGVSNVKIYTDRDEESPLLADCDLHFKTFVTQSRTDGWQTLPSAAQTTFILFAVVGAMLLCVCCLACRPSRKLVTDDDYGTQFKAMEDQDVEKRKEAPKPETVQEKNSDLAIKMESP
jgi:hypothetical protein